MVTMTLEEIEKRKKLEKRINNLEDDCERMGAMIQQHAKNLKNHIKDSKLHK